MYNGTTLPFHRDLWIGYNKGENKEKGMFILVCVSLTSVYVFICSLSKFLHEKTKVNMNVSKVN